MTLYKIKDFNPNYLEEAFNGKDLKGMTVHTLKTEEKIGSVSDILVDESGRFRYLVIDTGFWIFGKKVLVPVGRCRLQQDDRLYVADISSKKEVEKLPEYDDSMVVDYDYEERVIEFYRTPRVETSIPVEASIPVESSAAVEEISTTEIATPVNAQPVASPSVTTEKETYSYEQEPSLFEMNEQDSQKIRLYEERLIASKERRKSGDVSINKRVETSTAYANVPVEKERVVIERKTIEDEATAPDNAHDFQAGEVAHLEVYEETAKIDKQAFVREEVEINKEIVRDRVEASEELRKERLDVDVEGEPDLKN